MYTICFYHVVNYQHVITLSGSTSTVWQFIVFIVLLLSYPGDDRRSDQNTLVYNDA
jgi:hypothetical protein